MNDDIFADDDELQDNVDRMAARIAHIEAEHEKEKMTTNDIKPFEDFALDRMTYMELDTNPHVTLSEESELEITRAPEVLPDNGVKRPKAIARGPPKPHWQVSM